MVHSFFRSNTGKGVFAAFWTCFVLSFVSCYLFLNNGAVAGDPTAFSAPAPILGEEKAPEWPHESGDLKPDPAVVFGKLSNGFRYALMKNQKPEGRVSMHLNVQAGSIHETEDQRGLAHFLEHMLFCGSEHFRPGELVKYFQSIGMQFGADANAHTGFSETVYDILLPDGTRKSLEKGLLVMKDYAGGALLLESEIDRERKVILAEKRTRDSVSYRTFESTVKFELAGTRVVNRLPIGIEPVITRAGRTELKNFYDTWYRPEKMVLVIVGDMDAEATESLIKENFSDMTARAPAREEPDFGRLNHQGDKAFYHYEPEAGKTTVSIEMADSISPEPDSEQLQRRQVIESMANQMVQNRLDAALRRPDSPMTSAYIGSQIFMKYVRYAEMSAECGPENWRKTIALIEQTLRKALKYGFTQPELDRVKKDYLSGLDNAIKTAPTRDSRTLSREIIHAVNNDRVFQSPALRKEMFSGMIASLTVDDVHKAFKETWDRNHRLTLVTGNARLVGDLAPEKLVAEAVVQSRQVPVSRPKEIEAASFPYLPVPKMSGIVSQKTEIADLGVFQIDFENGVRLNFKQTDFKSEEILVSVCFGRGRSSEPVDKPGLSRLASELINESGFGGIDRESFERAMAGRHTYMAFGIEDGCFVIEGRTVRDEVPLLFQILYAYLKDPGFRDDAYALIMKRFQQRYEKLSQTIDGAMNLKGQNFLAGGDSRFGLPDFDRFRKLTVEDVRAWIMPVLENNRLEVSVVGDVQLETIVQSASKYLGTLASKTADPIPEMDRGPIFPSGKKLAVAVPTQIPKSLVVKAYPTDDFWDIHRTRRFSVLDEVVGDRLRRRIREKMGAAYSPYAYNHPSKVYKGYGVFYIMAYVAPDVAPVIEKEISSIISDLAKNGITQEELNRAKKPVMTGIKDLRKTNEYWLNSVLKESMRYPLQFDWCRTMEKDYASVSAKELSNLVNQYMDSSRAATVTIVPENKMSTPKQKLNGDAE